MRNFLMNDAVRRRALKRGGDEMPLSLEFDTAEEQFAHEPVDTNTPEKAFERHWALTLLGQVLQGLRVEWEAAKKGREFEALKASLSGDVSYGDYEALAADLGSTVNATRVAVYRLRRRFRQRLREEIADTVLSEEAIEDEIQFLFKALRG
jgi:RNA polymerase sigma-70 factor (ECF subfamily)